MSRQAYVIFRIPEVPFLYEFFHRRSHQVAPFFNKLGAINYLDANHEHGRACKQYFSDHLISESGVALLDEIIDLFGLEFSSVEAALDFASPTEGVPIYHMIRALPMTFVVAAAQESDGSPHERRFWACANNLTYWSWHLQWARTFEHASRARVEVSPARLVAASSFVALKLSDSKLLALNSLRMAIKHVDRRLEARECLVALQTLRRVVEGLARQAESRAARDYLRRTLLVERAERELKAVNVLEFVEKWNASLPQSQ